MLDMNEPVQYVRTKWAPRKGEEVIMSLFIQAIKDAQDVCIGRYVHLEEIMHQYYIALRYYNECKQYERDFML
jgi:hypothetical protein